MTHTLTQGDNVLQVDTLARVEGEGGMHILVRDGVVADVQLRIFRTFNAGAEAFRAESERHVPEQKGHPREVSS